MTYGNIKDGKIHYTHLKDFIAAVMGKFKEGERFVVIYKKAYKKRSSKQNGYYWAVIINCFLQGFEETNGHPLCDEYANVITGEILQIPLSREDQANKAHGILKALFNRDPDNDNIKSTTDNSTTQQEEYHEYCREYIRFAYDTGVPLPGEQAEINFK